MPQSIAPTSEQISRPLGRPLSSESSGAKWPLIKTSWQAAPGTRNGSISPAETATLPLDCAAEWNLRHRREVGKPPVLVVRGRKSLGLKARPGVLAQLPQPHRVALHPPCRSVRHTLQDMYSAFRSPSPLFLAPRFHFLSMGSLFIPAMPRLHWLPPSCIPCLQAPAPAPVRPSARSCHPPGRARSPSRCNPAAAGSA